MPNKTIYVAEADLELFQRAQELAGGNLSSAISQALQRYVEASENLATGFREITVPVGHGHLQHDERFFGVLVAQYRHLVEGDKKMEVLTAYRTAKDRIAVHSRRMPNWFYWSEPANWGSTSDSSETSMRSLNWTEWGECRLDVFETLEELAGVLPESLLAMLADAMAGDPVKYLDI